MKHFFGGGRGAWLRTPLRDHTRRTGPSLAFNTIGDEGYVNSVQPPLSEIPGSAPGLSLRTPMRCRKKTTQRCQNQLHATLIFLITPATTQQFVVPPWTTGTQSSNKSHTKINLSTGFTLSTQNQ